MNIIAMLVGAGIFSTGYLSGLTVRRRVPQGRKPPKAVCNSCDHGIGYHEERAGRCLVEFDEDYMCACSHYDGPVPLPEFYAPEITE